jgi:hypothetical protein
VDYKTKVGKPDQETDGNSIMLDRPMHQITLIRQTLQRHPAVFRRTASSHSPPLFLTPCLLFSSLCLQSTTLGNAMCDFLRVPINPALPSSPAPPNVGRRELELLQASSSPELGYCVHTSRLGYQNSARSPSIPLKKGDFRSGSLLKKEG